jgi:thiosulfate dehydrogenase [quinone] large subunit
VPAVAPTSASLGDIGGSVNSSPSNDSQGHQPPSNSANAAASVQTPTATGSAPVGGVLLGNISVIPKNQAGLYTDPASGDPALLVHLPDDRFFSFDAICPHAGCTVQYDSSQQLIVCPCHGATFDPAQQARVLAGPANQPLASLQVKILGNGDVYAMS